MIGHLRSTLFLVVIILATGTAGVRSASQPKVYTFGADKVRTSAPAANPRVQTIKFESKLVGTTLPYNVLLPVDYYQPAAKAKRYPVLYLLHGLVGHYPNWLDKTRLVDFTTGYNVIIVMPEGHNSWYTDSATVPADKYESYIVQELIPDVEKRFRASTKRDGRAIAGLSMGGYGALKFGVKHPEMFVFAASMSGALDAAIWTEADLRGLDSIWRTLRPVFGAADSETRVANDLSKLYRELSPARVAAMPYVYLDCGTEDVLMRANRNFTEILLRQKIAHEYRELPGNHSWTYWNAQVQEVLRIAAKRFRV